MNMKTAPSIENTPRVMALAIGFAAIMLARAVTASAFERFDRGELVAMALVGIGLGAAAVLLDPGLHWRARRLLGPAAGKPSHALRSRAPC